MKTLLCWSLAFCILATAGCHAVNLQDPTEVAALEGRSYLAGYIPVRVYLAVEDVDDMDVQLIRDGAYVLRASLADETIDPADFRAELQKQLSQVSEDDKLDEVLAELIPVLASELEPLILQVWSDPDPDEALKKEITRKCLIAVLRGVEEACARQLADQT